MSDISISTAILAGMALGCIAVNVVIWFALRVQS